MPYLGTKQQQAPEENKKARPEVQADIRHAQQPHVCRTDDAPVGDAKQRHAGDGSGGEWRFIQRTRI